MRSLLSLESAASCFGVAATELAAAAAAGCAPHSTSDAGPIFRSHDGPAIVAALEQRRCLALVDGTPTLPVGADAELVATMLADAGQRGD